MRKKISTSTKMLKEIENLLKQIRKYFKDHNIPYKEIPPPPPPVFITIPDKDIINLKQLQPKKCKSKHIIYRPLFMEPVGNGKYRGLTRKETQKFIEGIFS